MNSKLQSARWLLAFFILHSSFFLAAAGPVYFPVTEMTGDTNDVTVNVRAVNNPVLYNNRIYWLPQAGTNLTTTGGVVTNSFVPGSYNVTIQGIPKAWKMNVTNNTDAVSAVALSREIVVYSGLQSITGNGIQVTNDGAGNISIVDTNGGGSGSTEALADGQSTTVRTNGSVFAVDVTGTLTNDISGNAATATTSTNAVNATNLLGTITESQVVNLVADLAAKAGTNETRAVILTNASNVFAGDGSQLTGIGAVNLATNAVNATNVFGTVPSTEIPKSGALILYDFQGGGGQQVPNLAAPSGKMQTWGPPAESYFNELFAYSPVSVTLTDGFEDPGGYYRAVKAVAGAINGYVYATVNPTLPADSYTLSVWAKAIYDTNETFRLGFGASSYSGTFTVTTTWQRFSYSRTLTAGAYSCLIASTDSNSTPMNLYLYGPQLEPGTNATPVVRNYYDLVFGKLASSNAFLPTWNVRSLNFTNTQFGRAWSSRRVFLNQATIYAAIRRPVSPTYVLSGYNPICTDEGGSTAKFHLSTENEGGVGSFVFSGQSAKNWTMDLKDNEWHLVTGTHNGTVTRLWVDNFCVASNYTATVSTNFELRRWFVGNYNNSAFFNGDLAWMALYDTGHSRTEVAANYNAFKAKLSNAGNAMNGVRRTLIFEGDSITDQSTIGTGLAMYPWNVATNLSIRPHSRNFAISGSTLDNSATSLTNRAAMVDELLLGQTNVLSVLIGANDLGSLTAAQTTNWVARLKTYCDARQALGWRISLCTILPRTAAGFNTQRNIANDLIRADPSFYDSLADLAADTTIGEDADASDGTYYSDGTHPTVAGHAIIGPIIRASVATLLGL